MATTRGRLVQINQVILDQADFFQSDGFTRETGLTPADLTSQIFYLNVLQPWPLLDGAAVTDQQVVSGKVYWTEVPGSPGIYNIRWRPNALGYWRLLITFAAGTQIMGQDYDVVSQVPLAESGLRASTTRPCSS
jgi:hypothetical protein